MYKAGAGWNFTRPINAALYVASISCPLTFPLMLRMKVSAPLGSVCGCKSLRIAAGL